MTARPEPATLNTVLTIAQVAKLAGWSTQRMRRHLIAKHRELEAEGGVLLDVSRGRRHQHRWTITLLALQRIAPQWFIDCEALQRQIDWLSNELGDTQDAVATLSRPCAWTGK